MVLEVGKTWAEADGDTAEAIDFLEFYAREMLRWAEDAGLVLWSGLDFQEKPPPSPLRFVPTQSQMLQLLAAPPNTLLGERDRTILETIYGTGLRCGELCALNLQDLDGQGLWVRQGKGAKDRFVPIGPHLWSVLESYLKDVRPRLRAVGKSALFLARWGRRLGPVSLSWLIRRYARSLGLTGLCTHSLRHAFGTHMLEGGANLVEVKLLLGHSRLDSTQRYTQVHVAELIREYQRTHPRARRAR